MSDVRKFIRMTPKPTEDEALAFARSVMADQGVYGPKDGMSCHTAIKAFEQHAVDMSERMALEMCLYAIDRP